MKVDVTWRRFPSLIYRSLLFVFVLSALSLASLFVPRFLEYVRDGALTPEVLFGGAVATAGSIIALLSVLWFGLRSERSVYGELSRISGPDVRRIEERVVQRLTKLQASVELTPDERKQMLDRAVEVTADRLGEDGLKQLVASANGDAARRYEENALTRLADHIGALGSRANSALWVGVFFALIGVIVLGSVIVMEPAAASTGDIMIILYRYLPRLSLVLVVELVAFFFLRVYSRTLSDIRYMQNEITNIEMKLIGLHTSLAGSPKKVTDAVVLGLATTERNHILEKGQYSLENERERIESRAFVDALAAVAAGFTPDREKGKDKVDGGAKPDGAAAAASV